MIKMTEEIRKQCKLELVETCWDLETILFFWVSSATSFPFKIAVWFESFLSWFHWKTLPKSSCWQEHSEPCSSHCWKANTCSAGKSRTGQYQANEASKNPKSSFEQNLILTETQSKKELWSDNTHVTGFDRECFPTFWGGVNRITKFGECVTIAKSDGCNDRNSI